MSNSLERPNPDGLPRHEAARVRRDAATRRSERRGTGVTLPNGEETAYDHSYALNYHKGLPHDTSGAVHAASYREYVQAVAHHDASAVELLPMGNNRSDPGPNPATPSPTNPERFTQGAPTGAGYRKLTSPLTGHVFEVEGGDAAAFAIAPAPVLASDELAAEMAELYAMALLRDVPFTDIDSGAGANVAAVVAALSSMPWFNGSFSPASEAERRRYGSRGSVTSGANLFRGSTSGSKAGPWLSQFLLAGNTNNTGRFVRPNGTTAQNNTAAPTFRGTFANVGREDGFVFFGTQIIDQRSIVAREGVDYMTDWPSWLDAQNGVDFNGLDRFRDRRRYITTPRDIATYVHYDALYQAYLVACLLMLNDGGSFPKDRGLPETASRTRSAFASFGGPHILSLVTEVATRALKAVWRQKWLHHRRARPEVVAALMTLNANDPSKIASTTLKTALTTLQSKIPASLLAMVNTHNQKQNDPTAHGLPERIVKARSEALPTDFPSIGASANYLLPMAFPEGSPTHPAYGAGHATVAGACVTTLKAFFEMFEADGTTPKAWPLPQAFVASFTNANADEGGELVRAPATTPALTIQGELDKLAMNIANARNMAGVHYYTDYYESVRLGERIAVSIIEEQMSMYSEPVSVTFTSFDGDRLRISCNGGESVVQVYGATGTESAESWFSRYER